MNSCEEISKAIAAHGQWKMKLRKAIDTGECESTPFRVKQDCNCAFGKWLHYRIDPKVKASPQYPKIVQLHASFHEEAGSILDLALYGDKEEARSLIGLGSQFSRISAELTKEMSAWKSTLN
jgi:methyl-accepting chemotaxis protein